MFNDKALKYIFIVSLAIAIIFPLINIYFIYPSFSKLLIENTEDEAVRLAKHLESTVISKNELKKDSIQSDFPNKAE